MHPPFALAPDGPIRWPGNSRALVICVLVNQLVDMGTR